MAEDRSKKNQAYTHIMSSIINGIYTPGAILNEKTLVESLGLSKSPVREALIELCYDGVLRSIPRLGYEVVRLTDEDVNEIKDFRVSLECGFLLKYGKFISSEDLARLQELVDHQKVQDQILDIDALFVLWKMNQDFHLLLFSFYRNRYASTLLESAMERQTRAYSQFYWNKWKFMQYSFSADIHREVVEQLKLQNFAAAATALESDIMNINGVSVY